MAGDSLLGGSSHDGLSADSIALLDHALSGMTSATSQSLGGTTLVTGSNAANESSAILLPGTSSVSAHVVDGTLNVAVQLPTGVGIGFAGTDAAVDPSAVQSYLHGLIEAVLPAANTAPAVVAERASLATAVNKIVESMAAAGVTNTMVRTVELRDTSTGNASSSITLDASGSSANEVFGLLMGSVHSGTTVNLAGVENAVVVGSGAVKITGDAAAEVRGDLASQNITGGGGNDTLVGGGGSDTLVGGAGSDTFGIGLDAGTLTLGDISFTGGDSINFEIPGVANLDQLKSIVTGATEHDGNTTYFLNTGSNITLIGVSASDVDANLSKITFG